MKGKRRMRTPRYMGWRRPVPASSRHSRPRPCASARAWHGTPGARRRSQWVWRSYEATPLCLSTTCTRGRGAAGSMMEVGGCRIGAGAGAFFFFQTDS
jgi:hypothetical protein